MNESHSLRRLLALLLLASPLALGLEARSTAASGDGGVTLEPVDVPITVSVHHHSDLVTPQFLAAARIDLKTTPSEVDPPFATSYVEQDSPGTFSVIAENNREYVSTSRAYFSYGANSNYLQVNRALPFTVNDEVVTPPGMTDFDHTIAYIDGTVDLDPVTSAPGATIDYIQFHATLEGGALEESYDAYDNPEAPTEGNPFAYNLRMAAVEGVVTVTGYAHVTIPYNDGTGDAYAHPIYSMLPQYVSVRQGPNPEDIADITIPPWIITATLTTLDRGADLSGDLSALATTEYASHFESNDSLGSFLRHRVRGGIPGISESKFASPYLIDESGNQYVKDNLVLGTHALYAEHWWTNPNRYLRRPSFLQLLESGTNSAPITESNDPLAEVTAALQLPGFYSSAGDLSPLYVQANGPDGGSSRSYVSTDMSGSSFVLPVTGGQWTMDRLYARRSVAGEMNSFYQRYDIDDLVDVSDVPGMVGPMTANPVELDLYPANVVFNVLGADYTLSGGYLSGSSDDSEQCPTSPRTFYAVGVAPDAPVRSIRALAEPGCYRFDASMTTIYDPTPVMPASGDEIRSTAHWSDVAIEVDGEICDNTLGCSLLDDQVQLLFDESMAVSVTEAPIGPDVPNFAVGTSPSGTVVHYNITATTTTFADPAEVCITYDVAAVQEQGIDPDNLRLMHYVEGATLIEHCTDNDFLAPGFPVGDDWCDITFSHDPIAGQMCGYTYSLSPFAIFTVPDADGDRVPDANDNCPDVDNPDQLDVDADGIGDQCDPDFQGDGPPDPGSDCPAPGDDPYSCSEDCPCDAGIGDCDGDEDCLPGLVCLRDVGPSFGYEDSEVDVCAQPCSDAGVGAGNYCSDECPCDVGQGDCDSHSDCLPGLMCLRDAGLAFGYDDPELDVCSPVCPDLGVGAGNYCSDECPCDVGEGDCDGDSDCMPGLVCAHNVGASYDWPADTDVCELP